MRKQYKSVFDTKEIKSIILICRINGFSASQSGDIVCTLRHYEKHHGPKFLVSKLKQVKAIILGSCKVKLKGPLRMLVNRACKSRGTKIRVLRIINVVGRWIAAPFGKGDWVKFAREVGVNPPNLENGLRFLKKCSGREWSLSHNDKVKFLNLIQSRSRIDFKPLRDSSAHAMKGGQTAKGPQPILQELWAMTDSSAFYSYSDYLQEIFNIPEATITNYGSYALCSDEFVGIMAHIPEGGMKDRVVANLCKGWQVAISPAVHVYKAYLETQGMSALWDQKGAVDWMISKIREGKKISSIDLTAATDNLPLELFSMLMRDVLSHPNEVKGDSKQIELFANAFFLDEELCNNNYYTSHRGITVRYTVGQAMGRWTSKPQLDITMVELAKAVGANEHNARVNGDDIFITDTKVARRFRRALRKLSVPISETKTYSSKDFGEFSGMLADKYGEYGVRKGRKIDISKDPLGAFRQYGRKGKALIEHVIKDRKISIEKQDPTMLRKEQYKLHKKAVRTAHMLEEVASLPPPHGVESVLKTNKEKYAGIDVPAGPLDLKAKGWDPDWVESSFSEHSLQQVTRMCKYWKFLLLMTDHWPQEYRNQLLNASHHAEAERRKLRQLVASKDIAVKRFSEPNQRLNLIVDHYNAEVVETSDSHTIVGFGDPVRSEAGRISNSLRSPSSKDGLSAYQKLDDRSDDAPNPWKWIRRVYRYMKAWRRLYKR